MDSPQTLAQLDQLRASMDAGLDKVLDDVRTALKEGTDPTTVWREVYAQYRYLATLHLDEEAVAVLALTISCLILRVLQEPPCPR